MRLEQYYKILGLKPSATQEEVHRRFRKLAMQYHPDKNQSSGSNEKFIAITEAYEIISGKKPLPSQKLIQTPEPKQKEERVKEAQKRYQEQKIREYLENEKYFRMLTTGRLWKFYRLSAFAGALLSFGMILDLVLPYHFKEERIKEFNLNLADAANGELISLIRTENQNDYWVSSVDYKLYNSNPEIFLKSSWIFHNPISFIPQSYPVIKNYPFHFNAYSWTFLFIILFLTPFVTILFKRKNIFFSIFYHFSYYIVFTVMLLYIITGDRWAHILTLGFL